MPTSAGNGDDGRMAAGDGELDPWTYWRSVIGRATGDAWRFLRGHVIYGLVILVLGFLVGTQGGSLTRTLLLPLGVIAAACLLVWISSFLTAPYRLAHDEADTVITAAAQLRTREGVPIPPEHRDDLQEIARNLLKGVTKGAVASYRPPGEEADRPNIPISFTEHFPEIVLALEHWKGVVEAREAARRALLDWVHGQLPDAGFTGPSSPVAYFVAYEAESPEPRIEMQETAPDAMAFTVAGMTFRLNGVQDRAKKEAALRDLLDRTTKLPERAHALTAGSELEEAQKALIEKLEGIRDLVDIPKERGCALCGPTSRAPTPVLDSGRRSTARGS